MISIKKSRGVRLALALGLIVPGLVMATIGAGYTLFGDAMLVSPGNNSPTAAQTRSDAATPPNYGGVDFNIPAGLTVADLNKLSTDYMFTEGSCGGGSPRFQVNVTTPRVAEIFRSTWVRHPTTQGAR
jgi:hypothetical protein